MEEIPKEILMRAREGSPESFEKIYRASADFVYNVAYRITNNSEDASEAAQEALFKAYRNLKSFRFRSSFKTWLYRITVNVAISLCRKKSRDLGRRGDFDEALRRAGARGETEGMIEKEDAEALVKSMLNALNPDQRACVILRDIEGLSYKEMAGVLNININTVRSRLKRAREALLALRKKE